MNNDSVVLMNQGSPLAILPNLLEPGVSKQLQRMFRDPRVLEPADRTQLVMALRGAVELAPELAEVRVLLGMALAVDLQAQEALEQLRQAVEQAPDSFIARLKYGELLMRLRICGKAAEETHKAAVLAGNAAQAELARRQAATLRTMQREGIERGGYTGMFTRLRRLGRRFKQTTDAPALAGAE